MLTFRDLKRFLDTMSDDKLDTLIQVYSQKHKTYSLVEFFILKLGILIVLDNDSRDG